MLTLIAWVLSAIAAGIILNGWLDLDIGFGSCLFLTGTITFMLVMGAQPL